MRLTRWTRISLLVALPLVMFGAVACNDDNDVTGSGGALASLNLDMPETVNSGVAFDVGLTATAIGVTNVAERRGHGDIAGSDSGDCGRCGSGHVRDVQRRGGHLDAQHARLEHQLHSHDSFDGSRCRREAPTRA